ncbi:MAG: hypothetical protein AMXMBFR13_05770 [Phycisphaerae bacterium]
MPSQRKSVAGRQVKHQPQWLDAAYNVVADHRSNLQLGVGAIFPYACPILRSGAAIDYIAGTWLACKPLLGVLVGK